MTGRGGAELAYGADARAAGGAGAPERLARAALTRVLEPGDERGGRWLRECGAVELWRRITDPGGEAERLSGMTVRRLAGYRLRAAGADPERDLAAVAAVGGRFVCPGDREWPTQLDDLGDARPTGLWVRGGPDLRLWALRSVAVVGARACTPYGAHMATTLGAGLAERGWVVVSGAAFGVDGAAHRGALAAGGATMAVLACGVDVAYPRGHAELIGRVAGQGLVIGELPPSEHPTRSRFILRNRVIAALTRGTVVVEAEYRSGSLVTARVAQRLGRFTMGVPGPATSGLSAGVHELLRGDGVLVTDAAEVVELVGEIGDLAPSRRGPVVARDLLDAVAGRVLDALPARTAVDAREVARAAGTSADEALGKLYELHSLGFVEREGEGWRLTRRETCRDDARRGGS
ncbi:MULTISPECIES: DNA-processing protein DprA [unclassified Streptomyces]|uniref:DNA-processing protein DprA n=1 Tax=unclassified Streptomyces TaxID=2593676 RepID=UPI002E2D6DA5|nr:DNA-processing protein DprA [Streptomyces sp. NBC_01423]WSX93594.1 DNA-processing protein DprA [Streptomyces sp. NBC_00891]WSY08071.1 DNA-processing protein DprA [Streptomyces sp. NBC_00890]WSZ09695.1 DNA-processing protein DprA [Streptomyces sp. NBC_00869]WSZ22804.1 DNA-processing protein DprA [Streptomyces sp. NBC_00870]